MGTYCPSCGAENSPLAGEVEPRCLKCGAPLIARPAPGPSTDVQASACYIFGGVVAWLAGLMLPFALLFAALSIDQSIGTVIASWASFFCLFVLLFLALILRQLARIAAAVERDKP